MRLRKQILFSLLILAINSEPFSVQVPNLCASLSAALRPSVPLWSHHRNLLHLLPNFVRLLSPIPQLLSVLPVLAFTGISGLDRWCRQRLTCLSDANLTCCHIIQKSSSAGSKGSCRYQERGEEPHDRCMQSLQSPCH
jgi:hypothetical protein